MLILAALLLGAGIVAASWISTRNQVKPRMALAQFSLVGRTEDSENVTFTTTLFVDETDGVHQERMDKLYALREKRLAFQNERMQALQAEAKAEYEKAKADGKLPTLVKNPA